MTHGPAAGLRIPRRGRERRHGERTAAAGTGRSAIRRAEGERRSKEEEVEEDEEGKEGGRLALCRKPPAREHSSGKYP